MGFDCIHAFEPKTKRPLSDDLGVPDSLFMFCSEIVIFDHLTHLVKVCVYGCVYTCVCWGDQFTRTKTYTERERERESLRLITESSKQYVLCTKEKEEEGSI